MSQSDSLTTKIQAGIEIINRLYQSTIKDPSIFTLQLCCLKVVEFIDVGLPESSGHIICPDQTEEWRKLVLMISEDDRT